VVAVIPLPHIQVFDATGATPLGVLPGGEGTALAISDVFGDVGTMQLTVPRDATGASLLDTDSDVQLKVLLPGVAAKWFVVDDDSSTRISDDPASEPMQVTCRDLTALLDEAVVIPSGGIGTTPAEWAFTAKTPGEIVKTLFDAAQARTLIQGCTLTGGNAADAGGDAWPTTHTITHKAGTTLHSVLTGLRDARLIEWRWNARALEIYKPGGGLDRTLDGAGANPGPTILRPARDVISAPIARSRRAVATAVVVEGAAAVTARRTQALSGRRNREVYVSESSAPSGSLDAVADLYLAAHDEADIQVTHDVTDGTDNPTPWVDYRCGDRILTAAVGTSVVARRIQQIAVTWSDTGAKATLELGSLLKTQEEIMQTQIRRLLPGEGSVT
jgi:hypothetical protein